MLEIIVDSMLLLLLASIALWVWIYRRLDREHPERGRYYRWHQLLILLIAALAILLGVIIVLSSDPGGPDLYLQGY
ncbi:MAG TPA: hypothetical protein VIW27_08125 [Gammaproteobacteria bacterium]|jgi:amino acid transporter